jgi:sterol desaturase/sphingolipid hydroxylase (fatty acid hydroxylase superfamily)
VNSWADLVERFASDLVAQTPLGVWAAAVTVWTAIEIAAGDRSSWRERAANLFSGALVLVSMWAMLPALSAIVRGLLSPVGWRPLVLDTYLPSWAAALLFLALYDAAYYWFHRAQHAVPALWRIHAIHHSSTELTATSYARQHALEHALQTLFVLTPLLPFVALTPAGFAWVALLGAIIQFGAHSNLRWSLGVWLISPRLHRVHHAACPVTSRSNFASVLPLYDRVFGTYRAPAEECPVGLHSGRRLGLADLLTAPFQRRPL